MGNLNYPIFPLAFLIAKEYNNKVQVYPHVPLKNEYCFREKSHHEILKLDDGN